MRMEQRKDPAIDSGGGDKLPSYRKIRKIILFNMILLPFIPFILTMGTGYHYFTTSLETQTIASLERIVEDHRQMIESFLEERKSDLEFLIESYSFDELREPGMLGNVFNRLRKGSDAFVDLGIFNAAGLHVAYEGPYEHLALKDYSDTGWFGEVMKHGVHISDTFLGYRKIPHFIIAVAGKDDGKTWVIRATIDTHLFSDLVKRVRIGTTGEAYLLNAEGVFQTERRSWGALMEKDPDHMRYPNHADRVETFIRADARGNDYLYATTRLTKKDWLLIVRQEKADAFRNLRAAALLILFIAVLGGAVIVAAAVYLTGRIIRSMERVDAEKGQLKRQLVRASRLAELGEMTAGFAHEINNPLQIIKSEQSLMEAIISDLRKKDAVPDPEDFAELEDSIRQIALQISRCAQITQAILKFGRQSEPVAEEVDLKRFIPEVTAMITKRASVEGIDIRQEFSPDTPTIFGDPALIQQVLLNLFNNAMDAILAKHGPIGGEVVVRTSSRENGSMAEIRVQDNGCGISPGNIKKIFSPFFTTKPVGKGTGLGLSVCFGIIDNMEGVMEVSSEVGVGTTFIIGLRAANRSL